MDDTVCAVLRGPREVLLADSPAVRVQEVLKRNSAESRHQE